MERVDAEGVGERSKKAGIIPALFFLRLNNFHFHANILVRAIARIAWLQEDLVHYIHPGNYFTKHGVVIIEHGSSADLFIGLTLLGSILNPISLLKHIELR